MADKKISGLTELASGSITGNEELPLQSGGTSNFRLSLNSLKTWLSTALTNFATLTGTQTLTNKTLTSPKINTDVAITVGGANVNTLANQTDNIKNKFISVDGVLDGHDTRISSLESSSTSDIIYQSGAGIGAGISTFTINSSSIAGRSIDPTSLVCVYYEVSGLIWKQMPSNSIEVYLTSGYQLDKIIFAVSPGKSYQFVIRHR